MYKTNSKNHYKIHEKTLAPQLDGSPKYASTVEPGSRSVLPEKKEKNRGMSSIKLSENISNLHG